MTKHARIITFCAMMAVLTIFSLPALADRGAGVSRDMLPRELRGITVKNAFIPSSGKEAGVVQEVSGTVIIAHEGPGQAYFASAGDRIYEKDTFFTLKNSRCRFRLLFDDVISVGDNAKISVTKFLDDKKTKEKHASFNMAKGKVMFYSMRLFRYRNSSLTVETPTAIAGVRGTKFGVDVAVPEEEKQTARRPVHVADASGNSFIHLAQANPPSVVTTILAFDGNIFITNPITGQTQYILPGQSTSSTSTGLGVIILTPPGVSQQFLLNTGGSTSGGGAGISSGTISGATGGTLTPGTSGGTGTLGGTTDTTTVTQTQTTQAATQSGTTTTTTAMQPWTGTGYFTALLKNNQSALVAVYMSQYQQNFSSTIMADDISGYYSVTADGKTRSVIAATSEASGSWSGTQPVTSTNLGDTEYMSWGSWTQSAAMAGTSGNLYLDNPNFFVNGSVTATLPQGIYYYAGPSYGTVFTSSGGISLTGVFGAVVDFNGAKINSYTMSASSGSTAAIINISNISIDSLASGGNHFSATQNSGSWTLIVNGAGSAGNVSSGRLNGSFYGTTANNMGSVWSMTAPTGSAAGIAIGNTKSTTLP